MATDLNRIREQLNAIIADAAADIDARERALASAMELATESGSVRAAFNQGMQHKEEQILALIDQQLAMLQPTGTNPTALHALKRMIVNG